MFIMFEYAFEVLKNKTFHRSLIATLDGHVRKTEGEFKSLTIPT
jgi:hypothetical protein